MLKGTVEWISHAECPSIDRHGIITLQAFSEANRKLWLEAMDGKEPVRVGRHVSFLFHSKAYKAPLHFLLMWININWKH